MKLGFIGLGRMGSNMVLNLLDHKHKPVVYNRNSKITKKFEKKTPTSYSYQEMISKLPKRKIIWLMITSKAVDSIIKDLIPFLKKGDILIDGGNSYFKDSIRRHNQLRKHKIYFLDVGTSGGIEGARNGACMMIGGEKKILELTEKLFKDMCVKDGYGYMGESGAGHYVKMVHNGIEYGMMSAISEGIEAINKKKNKFKTNLNEVTKVYSNGSIIEGRLMSWTRKGMKKPYFKNISGKVPKGETEREMEELTKIANMPVLKQAIKERKKTRKKPSEFGKIISVMRDEFGGHKFSKN